MVTCSGYSRTLDSYDTVRTAANTSYDVSYVCTAVHLTGVNEYVKRTKKAGESGLVGEIIRSYFRTYIGERYRNGPMRVRIARTSENRT